MKLVRFGPKGREKPGLIDTAGACATSPPMSPELAGRNFPRPGDVICTGTPQGVGMERGRFLGIDDQVRLGVEGLGEQTQTIVPAPSAR